MTSVSTLTKSLDNIAIFFQDMITVTDPETGEVTEQNRMAYVQEQMLSVVIWKAHKTLQKTREVHLTKARGDVQRALREHRGDEISIENLARRTAWLERIQLQIATLEAFVDEAQRVYEKHTGRKYGVSLPVGPNENVQLTPDIVNAMRMIQGKPQVADDYNSSRANAA